MKNNLKHIIILNIWGKGLVLIYGIVSIPLFIESLAESDYAIWILCYSLTSIISLSDFGLTQVVANDLTELIQKDLKKFSEVFSTTFTINLIIGLSLFLISTILQYYFFPSIIYLSLLVFQTSLNLPLSLFQGVFRIRSELTKYLFVTNISKTLFFFGGLLIFIQTKEITPMVTWFTIINLIQLIVLIYFINRKNIIKWTFFKIERIRPYLKKSLFNLGYPLLNVVQTQGPLYIIKIILGDSFLIIFNTIKTMTNLPKQIHSLLGSSYSHEFNRLYFTTKKVRSKIAFNEFYIISVFLSVVILFLINIIGDFLLQNWFNLEGDYWILTFVMSLTTLSYISWNSSVFWFLSTNNQDKSFNLSFLGSIVPIISLTLILIIGIDLSIALFSIFLIEVIISGLLRKKLFETIRR